MAPTKGVSSSIRRYFLGLLVLTLLVGSWAQDDKHDLAAVKMGIEAAGKELECYVCTNLLEDCSAHDEMPAIKCNDLSEEGFIRLVYGKAAKEMQGDISEWPPSLTEAGSGGGGSGNGSGIGGGVGPPANSTGPGGGRRRRDAEWGNAQPRAGNSTKKPPPPETGWSYGKDFPAYGDMEGESSVQVSGLMQLSAKQVKNGFRSCRVMTIHTEDQKNDGRNKGIPQSNPRIVRTCSFLDKDECKTHTIKTATVKVCYCKGKLCNGGHYLRPTQFWILAAVVLALAGKIGLTD